MSYIYPDRFITPLPAITAAAAGATGNDLDCSTAKGCVVLVDITTITGTTPTITVVIEGKDEVSGKYYPILTSAALNATGTTALRVYPGLVAAANLTVNDILPTKFRIRTTIAGTTPAVTATFGCALVE